jgi:predicted regulator of Ras-like GTPase activity (Roadblock/LC7/MglB family)
MPLNSWGLLNKICFVVLMDSSLNTVFERLSKRPGVLSVTFCTTKGLVVQSTLKEVSEAHKIAEHFAQVVTAAQNAFAVASPEAKEAVEVLTVRSAKIEWVVTLADGTGAPASATKPEFFFVLSRDPSLK